MPSRKDIAREIEARATKRADRQAAELAKTKKPGLADISSMNAEMGIEDDPRHSHALEAETKKAEKEKQSKTWTQKTLGYVDKLKQYAESIKIAKFLLAPAGTFPIEDAEITKTINATAKSGTKYTYEKQFMDRNRTEVGLSPEQKLAKNGKTREEAESDIAEAESVLIEVSAEFQNDVNDLIPALEAKREEIKIKLKNAESEFAKTKSAEPVAINWETEKLTDDQRTAISGMKDPNLNDREYAVRRTQAEIERVTGQIQMCHATIATVQRILEGDPSEIKIYPENPELNRWGSDVQVARFWKMSYLILNRELRKTGDGVIKDRGTSYTQTGPAPKGHAPIPVRPSQPAPPTESIHRFIEILEGLGAVAALRYHAMITMPLSESAPLLKTGILKIKNMQGSEKFLNGRKCYLTEAKKDHIVVQLIDKDIKHSDRAIKLAYNEALIIDGSLKRAK